MLDAEDFQAHSSKAVENQMVFKIIHAPRTDELQIPAAKFPEPAFLWLQRQLFHCRINRLEKSQRGVRIVFTDILEVTKRIPFGGVADKNFNRLQAAREAK